MGDALRLQTHGVHGTWRKADLLLVPSSPAPLAGGGELPGMQLSGVSTERCQAPPPKERWETATV